MSQVSFFLTVLLTTFAPAGNRQIIFPGLVKRTEGEFVFISFGVVPNEQTCLHI